MRCPAGFLSIAFGAALVMGEEGILSSTGSSTRMESKPERDIPALKPLRWKHSQRKVHDPWKIYCGATFCYDVLEVSNRASPDEIRKSYRKLSREWHPDKHPEKKVADVKFKLIARAYEVVGKGKLERESYDYLMDHPEEYRKKHGEYFFKALPPQTSVPVVLLLVLLVLSGIHFTILRHHQQDYNDRAVKLCLEGKGPREGGTKETIKINKIAKERLAKNQIPHGAKAAIEPDLDLMDRIFVAFGYAPKVASPVTAKRGKKGNHMGNGHLKAIILELLKEENMWQTEPKIMDTLLFAWGRSAWFQISWFVKHTVLKAPLDEDERLYLLEATVDEWYDLSETEQDELYEREAWKKDELNKWRAEYSRKKKGT